MLGLEAWVYGINGDQWKGILAQAQKLKEERGDQVDAIIILPEPMIIMKVYL